MFNLKFNLSKIKDGPYRIILDRDESIKRYKSIIEKKKKKHDERVL